MPLSFIYFMGSSFGQITSLVIRNPFEVVKQQLQAGLYTGTGEAFYNIYRLQGIRGLYAELSHYISDKGKLNISTGNVIVSALSGSFAGGVAGALTNPLDVVKTRMMTQGEKKMYKSTWDCLTKIAVDEGTSALFKGLGLRVTWLTLGGFVFFAVLEAGKVTVKPILIKDYKIH
eukprot:XP_763451.1 hypothetical protein [Theileria parva strain Muguga]